MSINSDFELAEAFLKRAAEFGRYVSSAADNSINGRIMPCFNARKTFMKEKLMLEVMKKYILCGKISMFFE